VLRVVLILLCVPLLNACLYVELTGSVSGAEVRVTELRSGKQIGGVYTSTTLADEQQKYGALEWNSFGPTLKLLLLGRTELPVEQFENDKLYLVTASGGVDMDWNDDGVMDDVGTPIDGELYGVYTGSQLKKKGVRLNILTDGIYRLVKGELGALNNTQLRQRLDELASETVGDLNKDGKSSYADAISWSQLNANFPYPGDAYYKLSSEYGVAINLDDDVMEDISANLIQRADWRPADPDSAFAEFIIGCLNPVLKIDLCPFGLLPVIGEGNNSPAVADIMPRVVVTHDWMRDRFEQLLYRMPDDILLLLRSVTAIVIGDDIRPSYYDPSSAAINLDPQSLWVTKEEFETISKEADYRSDFGGDMNFSDRWRYVKDNDYAFGQVDGNGNSSLESATLDLAALLFHELAHAADFLPPSKLNSLAPDDTPVDLTHQLRSDILSSNHPLEAVELFGVAAVLFDGVQPSAQQKAYTGADIGQHFAADKAVDLYAYRSQYEDLAMTFEEAMMQLHFDVQRDVGFTSVPGAAIADPQCDDYIVGWGVRSRVSEPQIEDRLLLIVANLLPERNYGAKVAAFPAALQMVSGKDWCESLGLSADAEGLQRVPLSRGTGSNANLRPPRVLH
jgi:hypothetical protein